VKYWLASIAALGLAAACGQAQAVVHVTVSGEVGHPGEVVFEGKPRLGDVAKAAQVTSRAYPVGAAWLRPSLQLEQKRLKTGVAYELGLIEKKAMADGNESLATLARRMHDRISEMPVTGRKIVRTLEPHALQASAPDNVPVEEGDSLVYPSRPQTVTVMGAVEQVCDLQHEALRDARDYLAQCVASPFADRDVVFVIEPDGEVFERGVALWNRSPAMSVAPGAVLYVPLGWRATARAADERFNHDMADFIATQPLGGPGMKP
jgi:hypothetical protein